MSISDEEFQRFQNQLVDLKTRNYQLEEQNKKINAGKLNKISVNHFRYFVFILENVQLKNQLENVEKDSINLRLPNKVVFLFRMK